MGVGLAPCWPMGEDKSAEQAEVPMTVPITDEKPATRDGGFLRFMTLARDRVAGWAWQEL